MHVAARQSAPSEAAHEQGETTDVGSPLKTPPYESTGLIAARSEQRNKRLVAFLDAVRLEYLSTPGQWAQQLKT